jgi:hypothetical protein
VPWIYLLLFCFPLSPSPWRGLRSIPKYYRANQSSVTCALGCKIVKPSHPYDRNVIKILGLLSS